jgi:hypothetical protein
LASRNLRADLIGCEIVDHAEIKPRLNDGLSCPMRSYCDALDRG